MRILMVCLGNICRSPIAEGVMRHKVKKHGLNWVVDSAGTEAYHVGEPPHHLSQAVCHERGIDISMLRARKLIVEDFSNFDIIYAMAPDIYREIQQIARTTANMKNVKLFLNELHPSKNEAVPDPYYDNTLAAFEHVYQLIDKTCDAIISKHGF